MWKFELDGKEHVIDLFVSKISGKRKILLNSDIKLEAKKSSSYGSYPLRIGSHSLLIYEIEDNVFDLRCDNISFEAALMRNRSKSDFGGGYQNREDPFSRGGNGDPKPEPYRSRLELNEPNRSRDGYPEPYKSSVRWEQEEEQPYRASRQEQYRPEREEKRYDRSEEDVQRTRKLSPDPTPSQYGRPTRSSMPASPPKPVEHKQEKKPDAKPLDLFDTPSMPSSLPDDLFTKPLQASNQGLGNPYSMSSNPFESDPTSEESPFSFKQEESQKQPQTQQSPAQPRDELSHIIDLDGLHLGDGYSPAVARKMQEANKPIRINDPSIPNVPINQLVTNRPSQAPMTGMPMGGMNTMNQMGNPMAAMMAYNQFMTGMMMGGYMNPQQQFPK